MADQLTFMTIGVQAFAAPKRGRHYVKPRGYIAPPGSGPAGETCGSCQHIVRANSGRYRKCALAERAWSHGRSTDVLARSPACSRWERIAPALDVRGGKASEIVETREIPL